MSHHGLPSPLRALNEQQRAFAIAYAKNGDADAAKRKAGYSESVSGSQVLRQPAVAAAIRFEVMRLLATEGAQIGFGTLKRLALDTKAPAAAQVAAAKALLQSAGLLEPVESPDKTKTLTEYSQPELRAHIERLRGEIEQMEAAIADRALDVTPANDSEPVDPFT